jgi:hypothetical protein
MRRSVRPYLWVLGLLWVLPAVAVTVGYLLLPKDVAGDQCQGLGFGCTLAPADTLLLLGMFAAPVLLLAGGLGCALVAVLRAVRDRRASGR